MLLDRMGELVKKDYDWRSEVAELSMPTMTRCRCATLQNSSRCSAVACAMSVGKDVAILSRATGDRAGLHPLQFWPRTGRGAGDRGLPRPTHFEGHAIHAVALKGDRA